MRPTRMPTPPHTALRAALLLLALAAALLPAARPAAASALVPLDHPVYGEVEGWIARGVLPATIVSARPYSWQRLARLLDAAAPRGEADAERLAARRAEAAAHLPGARPFWARASVTGTAAEGHPVSYVNNPADSGGPLVADAGGVSVRETFGAEARLRAEAWWGDRLALAVEPRATFGALGGGNPGWQEGYAAFDLGPLAAAVGRQPFAWGQGLEGGLLLTPNAAPLPALRLGLTAPHAFSGRWAWLGTVDFTYLLARLEGDRVVPHPYLTGLRLMWRPGRHLELAASRTIMLGGEGRPALSAADYLTILSGRNLNGGADTSNSIAGVDAALTTPLPGGRGLKVYGEYAGEDEAGGRPTKPSARAGWLLSGLGPGHRITLRGEYAATDVLYSHRRWGHAVWYGHSVYLSGYTYRDRILGDGMGPDARDARLVLTRDGPRCRLTASARWLATRFSQPDRRTDRGLGLAWQTVGRPVGLAVSALAGRVTYDDARPDAWEGVLTVRLEWTLPG